MTKRSQALIPLTHDHHHALVQARALIAASDADPDTRTRVAKSFMSFYEKDTLLHFHEEEEILFPRLLEHVGEAPEVLSRVLVEHVRIHGMVAQLKDALTSAAPSGEQLKELGETLRAHVRLEENDLFPLIERAVPEADLGAVAFAERSRN